MPYANNLQAMLLWKGNDMNDLDEIYRIIDGFLVEAKDQHGNERSLERLNADRHLAAQAINQYVSKQAQENFLAKLATYDITDQQKILGGLIYKYYMLPTNANSIEVGLENFSHKGKVLGNLKISATLEATAQKGNHEES